MRISIAMATYNGANFLQEQLDSILAQTRLPDEIVITDDGSQDDTMEIIRHFANSAPFQVIWSQNESNLGYCGNFNVALQKTTGDYVFLCDQDDVWFPEKIERIVELAETEPQALVMMNDAEITDQLLQRTGLTKLGQIRSAGLTEKTFVMGCCAMVRRELLDICLPIPAEVRSHDNWIIGIADGLECKQLLTEVQQYYRRHGDNASQFIVNRTIRVTRLHLLVEVLMERLQQSGKSKPSSISIQDATKTIKELILEWAQRVNDENVACWLKPKLTNYREELQRQVEAVRLRKAIRSFPFSKRMIEAFSFWRAGGYKSFSGVMSLCVDVFMK